MKKEENEREKRRGIKKERKTCKGTKYKRKLETNQQIRIFERKVEIKKKDKKTMELSNTGLRKLRKKNWKRNEEHFKCHR